MLDKFMDLMDIAVKNNVIGILLIVGALMITAGALLGGVCGSIKRFSDGMQGCFLIVWCYVVTITSFGVYKHVEFAPIAEQFPFLSQFLSYGGIFQLIKNDMSLFLSETAELFLFSLVGAIVDRFLNLGIRKTFFLFWYAKQCVATVFSIFFYYILVFACKKFISGIIALNLPAILLVFLAIIAIAVLFVVLRLFDIITNAGLKSIFSRTLITCVLVVFSFFAFEFFGISEFLSSFSKWYMAFGTVAFLLLALWCLVYYLL